MYIYYPNYFPLKEIFRYSTSPTSFYISGNNAKKRKNVHEPHTSTCILWPNCINLTVSLQKISQQHSLVRVVCFVSSWFYSSCPPGDFSYLCSVFFYSETDIRSLKWSRTDSMVELQSSNSWEQSLAM